eukprot:1536756-Amphidinium_carterae.2
MDWVYLLRLWKEALDATQVSLLGDRLARTLATYTTIQMAAAPALAKMKGGHSTYRDHCKESLPV